MKTQLMARFSSWCLISGLLSGAFIAEGTPADGTVVGATKIVDHGPDAQRYTIVLIAEGYQQSEMTKFAQDAQYFVDYFFKTPPFNTNCSAFNVYRIDVTSTQSGADDPATCGDGSTGLGTMVNTYFDATFCGDGNARRLLTVNNGNVINVANAQVPGWDTAVVMVNTTDYGGAGGGQVGVTSLAGSGWPDIAIHEFGHAAFGLGDEYEYYLGCTTDPAGTRDHHPNVEPAQANLTVETNPTLVKWRSLFFPGITIPTALNGNCAQCDSQGDPFPGQVRVGLYEGADYYHCDAFRPVFNCKFRVLSANFCPVCIQRMLQVLQPFMPPNGAPVANVGGPYLAECTRTTSVTLDGSKSSDPDCNQLTFTWTGPFIGGVVTAEMPTVQFNGAGVFAINLVASDGLAATTASTTVTIRDTTAPVIHCPPNITRPTDPGVCQAVVAFTVIATDTCDSSPVVISVPPSGSVFPKGITTVNCTATDGAGNSSSCRFTVTVVDTEPPKIVCPADIVRANDPGLCSALVNFQPTVTDNCPGVTFESSPPSGSIFPKGTTTVASTARDGSGNTASCSFKVTVLDKEPPKVSCVPGPNPSGRKIPGTSNNPHSGQNPDGFYQVLAKDNCDPHPKIYVKDSASSFVAGPFVNGDDLKIVQAPGVAPGQKRGPGVITAEIHLKGDALIYGVDVDANASTPIRCLLPPPSK